MSTLQLTTPSSAGTRDLVRSWLASALPENIAGQAVEIDFTPLRVPTPSFIDELLKILVVERGAAVARLKNANERAESLARQAAANRGITHSVEIEESAVRPGLLDRIRR